MLMWLPPSSELEVTTGRIEAAHCGGRGAPQSYPQYPQAIEKRLVVARRRKTIHWLAIIFVLDRLTKTNLIGAYSQQIGSKSQEMIAASLVENSVGSLRSAPFPAAARCGGE